MSPDRAAADARRRPAPRPSGGLRTVAVLSLLIWAGSPGVRAAGDDVVVCLDVADDARRLACYDDAARRLRAAAAGSEERGAVVADEVPAAVANEARQREAVRRGRIEGTSATVDRVELTARGRRLLTLSNGERWVEVEPDRDPVAPGDSVVVTARTFRTVMRLESGGVLTVRPVP